jgi:DNA-binding beta-propeller fold protein YncE
VAREKEGPLAADDLGQHAGDHKGMKMPPPTCSPTWAQPDIRGKAIFVACNKADEIIEIDAASWKVSRRFKTGRGPYNLAVSPDGKLLVATLKQGGSVQIFDLTTGQAVMTEKSSTTVTHGVVISPDSRYAFVSVEGIGAEPGKVDIFDLRNFQRVASVEVGQQAGGIAFWKMEKAKPGS